MKTIIIAVLIVALVSIPQRPAAQPEPQWATLGCLIVAVAVGATVVYGLYKICDRAFPPPPPTNKPPTNPPTTTNKLSFALPITAAEPIDQWTNIQSAFHFAVESSTEWKGTWTRQATVSATISAGQVVFVTSIDGVPVLTNAAGVGSMTYNGDSYWAATNDIHTIIPSAGDKRFWRITPL